MDEKILILEDDQPFAEMLLETFEASGLLAEISLDPEDALERVREGNYRLLVSDYLMPKLEGTAFIRKVREFNQSIPVLMISAYMGEAEMQKASEAGVARILKKPFETKDLIGEIQQLLSQGHTVSVSRGKDDTVDQPAQFSLPLRYLPPVTEDTAEYLQRLHSLAENSKPIFLTGGPGTETDLIAAEVSDWRDSEGGSVSFDFNAGDLLGGKARQLISQFAGKGRYSSVVIGRNIDRLDRSQQNVLREALDRPDSFLRQNDKLVFLFPIEETRLSLAEMSMDEDLLEMVFANLIRVPDLRGRYKDISTYLLRALADTALAGFEPGAVSFLLRYEWPGNFAQLQELCGRLAASKPGGTVDKEDVRAALEKRFDHPLEESGDPHLSAVLKEKQTEVLSAAASAGKANPKTVLEKVGCGGVEPAETFPEGQDFLFPDLLEVQASD